MTGLVLVVDDDRPVRDALAQTLELEGYEVISAGSFVEAKDHMTAGFAGVILSDLRMPGRDGFHLLDHARRQDPELPVILLTGEGDIPMAVRAMAEGAFDFLEKPCAPSALTTVLERALQTRRLVLENRRLKLQVQAGDPAARMIFGRSTLSEELRQSIRAAATTRTEVLVTGPPGSGISKVAEVVHLSSDRSQGPFFKRASVGLNRETLGDVLSRCAEGSLFLDDIAALSEDSQLALLDHLEARQGARVIAGCVGPLPEAPLHPDMFYRLQAVTIRIPALSERPEDIEVLFRHYVDQASEQSGHSAPEVTPEVLAGLLARDWPGNARALMSEAMRFVLGITDLPDQDRSLGLNEQLAQVERSLLISALQRAGGGASEAARALKLPRKTFYDRLSRYGLRPEDYRV